MGEQVEQSRANWGSHVEFILTLVGFAVGLGNVWRFPYLCFENGGGAFLIPYFVSLAVMGIPLFYLELCFGQFASLGPVKIWIANPAMKGLGFSMTIVSFFIALYYDVIIAICVFYFFASMRSELPWLNCDLDWASCYCRDNTMNMSNPDPWNDTRPECANVSIFNANGTVDPKKVKSPSEEYFYNRVLKQTPSLAETGGISWELSLCLLLVWLIVFLVLTKGIKSLGKVVYVTAVLPYVLLTILLVRGCTLDGYKDGIDYYLTPNITKLTEASVWSDAAVQIFYSLSACSGGLIAMASYNDFNNNILRDALLVPAINCLTSFYAGFVIFASLGFMAYSKNTTVKEVADGGPGLAFIAYPEALGQMPVAPLWAILFFLMMMMLGFSSSFSIVETVLTGWIDELTFINKSKKRIILFRAGFCLVGFVLGLPMVTGAGFHLLDIVDNATGGFPLLIVGLFEIIAIIYMYGLHNFMGDIRMMLGTTPRMRSVTQVSFFFFVPMWAVITPLCLLAVIVFKAIQYERKSDSDPDIYEEWADAIWWLIVVTSFIFIPVWFLGYYCKKGGWQLFDKLTNPQSKWGPLRKENKTGRYTDHSEMATTNGGTSYPEKKGYDNNGFTDIEVDEGIPAYEQQNAMTEKL